MKTTSKVRPGDAVGAGRWPFSHAHPECWSRPLERHVATCGYDECMAMAVRTSAHVRVLWHGRLFDRQYAL